MKRILQLGLSMKNNNGTPKTLTEAIEHSLDATFLSDKEKAQDIFYHILRDFMAQKFGVAYMEALDDKTTLRVLEKLFEELTKRD